MWISARHLSWINMLHPSCAAPQPPQMEDGGRGLLCQATTTDRPTGRNFHKPSRLNRNVIHGNPSLVKGTNRNKMAKEENEIFPNRGILLVNLKFNRSFIVIPHWGGPVRPCSSFFCFYYRSMWPIAALFYSQIPPLQS